MDTLLIVEGLSFRNPFTGEFILKDVTFNVRRGEIIAIHGPSGSGKSTLLKILDGYRELDIVSGKVVKKSSMIRVPQEPYSRMLHPSVKNILSPEGKEMLLRSGRGELLTRKTFQLSYGEKKLVTIIHALTQEDLLIIMDEPFAGLDEEVKKFVKEEIKRTKERGKGFIIVDHTGTLPESEKKLYIDTELRTLTDKKKKHQRRNFSINFRKNADEEVLLKIEKIEVKKGKRIIKLPARVEIKRGEIFFITGKNGSGKTTILRTVAGWEMVVKGEINFKNRRWRKIKDRRGKIFFLTQIPETNFTGNTLDDLTRTFKISREKIEENGLTKNLHTPLVYMSYGEKIKVNLLIGEALEPELIMIDETYTSLDSRSLESLFQFVARWTEKGAGVIITSPEPVGGSFSLNG